MKRGILSILFVLFVWVLQAQTLEVIVADSVGIDGTFDVTFKLENADGDSFQAPDLSTDFEVVSGPNMSTSMQFMNGEMSQSLSYIYTLKAKSLGTFVIEPAMIVVDGEVVESQWKRIVVAEGIVNKPKGRRGFFGEFSFPDMRSMPRMEMPKPDLKEDRPKKRKKPKKKRKIYKI